MNETKQRIRYLIEHGGIYPDKRPAWLPWAAVILATQVVILVLQFR